MSKVVLISGGTKGIGKAISEELFGAGHRVAVFSPFDDEIQEFNKNPDFCDPKKVLVLKGDVTNEASIKEVVQKTVDCFGRIDVLINNAGMVYYSDSDTANFALVRKMFDINVIGVMMLTQAVVAVMKKQGGGQIISTVSTAGRHVGARGAFYGATKHGLMGYSQGMRIELAAHNIKVATVCPGITNTDAIDPEELARRPKGEQAMLEPREVAHVFRTIVEQSAGSDIRDILITPFGSTRYHF